MKTSDSAVYRDLINAINTNKRIAFVSRSDRQASYVLKLVLSFNQISNKTILEQKSDIDFINTNLLTDPSVRFLAYAKEEDISYHVQELVSADNPFIAIYSKTNYYVQKEMQHQAFINLLGNIFDTVVNFNDSENYSIISFANE